MTGIDLPATSSHRRGQGRWGRALQYLGGVCERFPQRRHAGCPDLGWPDECLVAGVVSRHTLYVHLPELKAALAARAAAAAQAPWSSVQATSETGGPVLPAGRA
jgi:hypothetical protein